MNVAADKQNLTPLRYFDNGDGTLSPVIIVDNASSPGSTTTEITNDEGNPIPVSGTVTITNPTANPETGLAKDASLTTIDSHLPMGANVPSASRSVTLPNDVTVSGGQIASGSGVLNLDLITGTGSGWFDASNYHSVSIQVQTGAGISAGVISFEQTNNTTASPNGSILQMFDTTSQVSNPLSTLTVAASTTRFFGTSVLARYIRVRISTAVAGGTIQATAAFSQLPFANPVLTVQQATAANLSVTASGSLTSAGTTTNTPASSTTTGSFLASAATTNATTLKAGAGTLYSVTVTNIGAAVCFLKLFNKASNPTLGTDAPVATIAIPASGVPVTVAIGALGQRFATGIAYAITNLIADNDTTAVVASQVKVMWSYI